MERCANAISLCRCERAQSFRSCGQLNFEVILLGSRIQPVPEEPFLVHLSFICLTNLLHVDPFCAKVRVSHLRARSDFPARSIFSACDSSKAGLPVRFSPIPSDMQVPGEWDWGGRSLPYRMGNRSVRPLKSHESAEAAISDDQRPSVGGGIR